ncbi:MAG: GDSL-type esterase/lipase family protein [Aliarcobacter sp.]|nr:GDSL-type esterase/lipase family protein [Aliarcobacter sp.]
MKYIIISLSLLASFAFSAANLDPYYLHKKSQFEMLEQNDKYKTVMIGDSITDGGLWNELLNNDLIQNRGIAGDTTDGVLDRLDSVNKNLKQAFIMIGINDFFQEKSVDYVFSNYLKIIENLQQKGIKVYIQSTLFVGESKPAKYNQKVEALNEKLKSYAKENSLIFIDLNKILASNKTLKNEFSYDELHLNGKAYKLWTQEIKKYF